MIEDFIGFVFSALVGVVLVVVIALLARRSMVKEMKRSDEARLKKGEAECHSTSDGPNQG